MVATNVPSGRVNGLPLGQPITTPMPIDGLEARVADLLTPTTPKDTTTYVPGRTMRYRAEMERLTANLGTVVAGIWSNQFSKNLMEICEIYFTDEQKFLTSEVQYGQDFPRPTPVHGTSRAITYTETSKSFSQIRLGQSFRINYDLVHLPEFVKEFMTNLVVLAGRAVKLAEFGLLESLLAVERHKIDRESMKRMVVNAYQLMINDRNYRTGIAHKSNRGLMQVIQMFKLHAEHALGRPFTHAIWPKDKPLFLASTEQYANYDKAGENGPEVHLGYRTLQNINGIKFMEPPSLPGTPNFGWTTMSTRQVSGMYHHYYRMPDQDVPGGHKWVNLFDITTNRFETITEDEMYAHIPFVLDVENADTDALRLAFRAFMVYACTDERLQYSTLHRALGVDYERTVADAMRGNGGGTRQREGLTGTKSFHDVLDTSVPRIVTNADVFQALDASNYRGNDDLDGHVFCALPVIPGAPAGVLAAGAHGVPGSNFTGESYREWAMLEDNHRKSVNFRGAIEGKVPRTPLEAPVGAAIPPLGLYPFDFVRLNAMIGVFGVGGDPNVQNQYLSHLMIAEGIYDAWTRANVSASGNNFRSPNLRSPYVIIRDLLLLGPTAYDRVQTALSGILHAVGTFDVWYTRAFLNILGFELDAGVLWHPMLGDVPPGVHDVDSFSSFEYSQGTETTQRSVFYKYSLITAPILPGHAVMPPTPVAPEGFAAFVDALVNLNVGERPFVKALIKIRETSGTMAFRFLAEVGPKINETANPLVIAAINWMSRLPAESRKEKIFSLDIKEMMAAFNDSSILNAKDQSGDKENPYVDTHGYIKPEWFTNTSDNYFGNGGGVMYMRPVDSQNYTRILLLSPAPGAVFLAMSPPIFTEGLDAATQTGLLSSTFYFGAHVVQSKSVVVVPGTMYSSFIGGYNTAVHTYKSARKFAKQKRFLITNAKEESMWAVPVKKGSLAKQPFIHTVGVAELHGEEVSDKPEYPHAKFWSKIYGFDKAIGDVEGLTSERSKDVISKQLFPCTHQYMTSAGLKTVYGNTCHGQFSEGPGAREVRLGGGTQYKVRNDN